MHLFKNPAKKHFRWIFVKVRDPRRFLHLIFITGFLLIFQNAMSNTDATNVDSPASTIWIRNYPVITKALTSVFFKIRLNQPGKVYYVFYDTTKAGINTAKIKTDALGASGGDVIKKGVINYPDISNTATLLVDGFTQAQFCHLYIAAESADTIMFESDIQKFNFPMKLKHTIVPIGTTSATYGYLEYLPDNYCSDCIATFPLIVFLHGSGGVGDGTYAGLTNPTAAIREGLTRYLELDTDLPAVVISPQSSGNWNIAKLNTFIDYLKLEYNIDPGRVYITGISMGGEGAWQYATTYPDQIAAVVPLCGAVSSSNNYSNLASIPVWAFHNNQDPTVPVSFTYNIINGIIHAGGHPLMSIFRSDDHSCAYEAYHFPGLWEWLFSQRKDEVYKDAGITKAYKASVAPVIDGTVDEISWSVPEIAIERTVSGSPQDSATFRLLWDLDRLYIGVKFKNGSPSPGLDQKQKEVVVFLNGDNDTNVLYDSFDKYICFNYATDTLKGVGDLSGVQSAWIKDGNNYSMEAAIPFQNSYYPIPIAGDGFGFDIQVNITDTINMVTDGLIWNGNEGNMDSTSHFGHALLSLESYTNYSPLNYNKSEYFSDQILYQNYPNPFNEKTTVAYSIERRSNVFLSIKDISGRDIMELVNELQGPGSYFLGIDGSKLKSGIYLIELITPVGKKVKQIVKL
jgi:predicted esterase